MLEGFVIFSNNNVWNPDSGWLFLKSSLSYESRKLWQIINSRITLTYTFLTNSYINVCTGCLVHFVQYLVLDGHSEQFRSFVLSSIFSRLRQSTNLSRRFVSWQTRVSLRPSNYFSMQKHRSLTWYSLLLTYLVPRRSLTPMTKISSGNGVKEGG